MYLSLQRPCVGACRPIMHFRLLWVSLSPQQSGLGELAGSREKWSKESHQPCRRAATGS